jgi:hypothetical protein
MSHIRPEALPSGKAAIGQSLFSAADPILATPPPQATTRDNLWDEFIAATAAVSKRDFQLLVEDAGVPSNFLWGGAMRFGVAVIAPCDGGFYEIAEGSEGAFSAFILPALPLDDDGDDDLGDLIAFNLSEPDRWWVRRGTVPILNPVAILRAEIMRERLLVVSSPLAWLRGAGSGAVILDWQANLRLHLGGLSRGVAADSEKLARAIERRLAEPRRPTIYVREVA